MNVEEQKQSESAVILYKNNRSLNINSHNLYNDSQSKNTACVIQSGYLDLIKTNKLNILDVDIVFNDKIWDFSTLKKDYLRHAYYYKLSFVDRNGLGLSDYYETLVKFLTLNLILEDGVIRGYHHEVLYSLKPFLRYLYENRVYTLDECTYKDINDYLMLSRTNLKERSITKIQTAILKLFTFYSMLTGKSIDKKINNLLTKKNTNRISIEQKENLIKLLPSSFMKNLTSCLYEDVQKLQSTSPTSKKLKIMILIYTLIQTGIRPAELFIIPRQCIIKENIKGITITKLQYNITKTIYGDGISQNQTILNKKTEHLINYLIESSDSKYLSSNIGYYSVRNFLYDYCINNAYRLGNISDKPDKAFMGRAISIFDDKKNTKYINIPTLKQFRVYFDSELKRRGYNEYARAKLLGHSDEKMLDYYGRSILPVEDDFNYTSILVKDLLADDNLKILGLKGDVYTSRIRKFLEQKKIEGVTDIDTLVRQLNNELPIRSKPGGYCIKPDSNYACKNNNASDELLCSYGLCKNQHHLILNSSYHYDKFKEMQKIYYYNLENGYTRFAEKELYKIQGTLQMHLIPEIKELHTMIDKESLKCIEEKYKDILWIIENINEVEEEIETWMNKN